MSNEPMAAQSMSYMPQHPPSGTKGLQESLLESPCLRVHLESLTKLGSEGSKGSSSSSNNGKSSLSGKKTGESVSSMLLLPWNSLCLNHHKKTLFALEESLSLLSFHENSLTNHLRGTSQFNSGSNQGDNKDQPSQLSLIPLNNLFHNSDV